MLSMAVMPGAPTLGVTKAKNKSLRKGETSQRVAHGVRPAVGYKKRELDAGDVKIGRGEASFRVRGTGTGGPCRANVSVPLSLSPFVPLSLSLFDFLSLCLFVSSSLCPFVSLSL